MLFHRNERILFIANIQDGQIPTGGGVQFKNHLILKFLQDNFDVISYDTWSKNPFVVLLSCLFLIIKYKERKVIFSIGFRGIILTLSILEFILSLPDMYLFVPGKGVVNVNHRRRRLINKMKGIFVQTESIKRELAFKGINNVIVCPNFKEIKSIRKINNILTPNRIGSKRRFVFIGRFIKDKGIEDIISAANILYSKGITDFKISFLGKITSEFDQSFFDKYSHLNIEYNGFLNLYDKVNYKVLWQNDVLLFPTHFEGEGFPGVLIDAFISGLAIIATRFGANEEILDHDKNCLFIDANSPHQLAKAMNELIEDKEKCRLMKNASFASADKYEAQSILTSLLL